MSNADETNLHIDIVMKAMRAKLFDFAETQLPKSVTTFVKKRVRLITGDAWDELREMVEGATEINPDSLAPIVEGMRTRLLEYSDNGIPTDYQDVTRTSFDLITADAWDDLKQITAGKYTVRNPDKVSRAHRPGANRSERSCPTTS